MTGCGSLIPVINWCEIQQADQTTAKWVPKLTVVIKGIHACAQQSSPNQAAQTF